MAGSTTLTIIKPDAFSAELLLHVGDQLSDRCGITDIAAESRGAVAYFARDNGCLLPVASNDCDPRPTLREGCSDGTPDSARAPRDHCGLAGQIDFHWAS